MASYQTIRKLSDGASADVFLARAQDSHEPVILEVMRPEVTAHGDLVERFLGEAKLRSQLLHPNLARRVRGGRTRDGRPYIVTEAIHGESLRDHLRIRGPLTAEQVCRLALPLCDALGCLHGRGVVHKNLTPAAVFLPGGLEAMRPKLFDASLALLRGGQATTPKHGVRVVESAYMAPERAAGQRADSRSDLYSLGVVLHEALTGRLPSDDAPPYAPEQAELGAVLLRCMAKSPAGRFETVQAVRDALVERCRHTLVLEADVIHASVPAGDVIGQYELLEVLGEGAIGTVYRARHLQLGRQVALKVLRSEHVRNARLVKRFRDEARAVNRINHPHIVQIVDLCEEAQPEGPNVYCVMELLRGCTVEELLDREPLSVARCVRIGLQVSEALAAAHAVGVIHRDVKPANIFLLEPGEKDFVKLLDFGVAKLKPTSTDVTIDANVESTAQGALLGTPTYMSPEQASSGEVDVRTDLYALGVTLYRMLAGHLPFGGPSFADFLKQILNEAPTPMPRATLAGEVIPPRLRDLVMQCLAKAPAQRPATAAAVRDALRAWGADRSRLRPQGWWWLGIAAALLGDSAVPPRAATVVQAPPTAPAQTQVQAAAPIAPPVVQPPPPAAPTEPPKRSHPTRHRHTR